MAELIFSKSFEHQQKLFDAALEEFVAKGYEQASINAILKAAGMSKGQFYHHFGSKEALYLALAGVLIQKKRAFMARVMQPGDFQQDIFGVFAAQMRYGAAFAREYPAINRFSESFLRETGTAIYVKALETYNFQDNDAIGQMIEAAYARGEFRPGLPLSFVKRIIGYLFTHAADILGLERADAFEEDMLHLIDFMKSGLARETDNEVTERKSTAS